MIEVRGVVKSFGKKRDVHAVRDVSFVAPDGQITGLLGPNGAGKTTLLRILATLIVPDAGQATVAGLDVVRDRFAVRERIGVLSDARGLYPRLTARENIRYYGGLHGLTGAGARRARRPAGRTRSDSTASPTGARRDSRRARR